MKDYQVTFYRHLVNNVGSPFKSRLTTIRVADCADTQQAFRRAVRRFEYDWSLYEWRNLADGYEILETTQEGRSAKTA